MQIALLYLATAGVFLVLDALMLNMVLRPLFEGRIGAIMAEPLRMGPAAVFYLAYVAGLLYLVSVPALRAGDPMQALVGGAVLGFVAYGTYEFTNYAVLRDWHWTLVAVDLTWGTALTAVSAWAGVAVLRAFG
ncbi:MULTISPECIES: DUF2177 family protein [unclassified Rhodosalinus]|uniref:DUF2177 family protein n=1 Tax=unclassified Rhodosalinus TaxID=2630183 RepID=UPI00352390A2